MGCRANPMWSPTATKVELIGRLVGAGLRRIEVASFVNPKRVPQMADGEAVLAALPAVAGVQYVGLVLNRKGFDRALAAGCTEIGMVVAATDSFAKANQGATCEETIATWEEIAPLAHEGRHSRAGNDFRGVWLPVRRRGAAGQSPRHRSPTVPAMARRKSRWPTRSGWRCQFK